MPPDDDPRIRQMVEAARQDMASGRGEDAARRLRQVVAQAPNHPLVLGEVARQRLMSGDPATAHRMLKDALAREPAEPSLWIALAAAERSLGNPSEEGLALEKALELEPRNIQALMRLGALQAARGESRLAAVTYRTALQSIPAGASLPPDVSASIQTARAAIDASHIDLEAFLENRFQDLRSGHSGDSLERFDAALSTLLLKRRVYRPQPTFLYFPFLPAPEFYDRGAFPWLEGIEAATDDMRAELLALFGERAEALEPYVSLPGQVIDKWRELNKSRRWGVFFLWHEGVAFEENIARCPRTVAALEAWPRCDIPGCSPTAMFSILDAKTRIPPHTGVNNCRLIVHVPLIVPPGCGFRVGGETRPWEPGKAFVFDDTIEHEAWNDSPDWRAVLILDIWNPHLSAAERDLVRALCAGVDSFYGDLPAYVRPPQRSA